MHGGWYRFTPQFPSPLTSIHIDRDKVLRLASSLNANKGHGCDGSSVAMINICHKSIVDPLCCIFERCLETGICPTQWKKANIIPLHNKGFKQDKKIIALFLFFQYLERFFEKLFFDVLYEHLCKHDL